jgi:hypothetical protein
MRNDPLDSELHVPTSLVVGVGGATIAALLAAAGWFFRLVARETLEGFKATMKEHTKALEALAEKVEEHRREMADLRVVQADFNARLKALERDHA